MKTNNNTSQNFSKLAQILEVNGYRTSGRLADAPADNKSKSKQRIDQLILNYGVK